MEQAEQMNQVMNREIAKRVSRRNSTSDEDDYSSKPISKANSPLRKEESASKMLQQRSNATKSQLRYADSLSDYQAPQMANHGTNVYQGLVSNRAKNSVDTESSSFATNRPRDSSQEMPEPSKN
jgi:hypothetical protein